MVKDVPPLIGSFCPGWLPTRIDLGHGVQQCLSEVVSLLLCCIRLLKKAQLDRGPPLGRPHCKLHMV